MIGVTGWFVMLNMWWELLKVTTQPKTCWIVTSDCAHWRNTILMLQCSYSTHASLLPPQDFFPYYLFWLASVILDFFWACWCLSSQVFPLTTSKAFPVFIATMLQPDQMFFQGRSAARQELRQFWPPYFSSNFCATAFGHFIPRGAPFSKVCKVKYTKSSRFTCTALH